MQRQRDTIREAHMQRQMKSLDIEREQAKEIEEQWQSILDKKLDLVLLFPLSLFLLRQPVALAKPFQAYQAFSGEPFDTHCRLHPFPRHLDQGRDFSMLLMSVGQPDIREYSTHRPTPTCLFPPSTPPTPPFVPTPTDCPCNALPEGC